jgi:hypothetical protein
MDRWESALFHSSARYLPLNIVPVAIVLIALMLVWEYVAGKKDKGIEKREKEKKRVKGKK